MKKNIAICFSGAIRSFHLSYENINKMIIEPLKKNYNVYIFGHFWVLKQEENLDNLSYKMKWKKESDCVYNIISNFNFTQYVIDDYSPLKEKEIMENLGTIRLDTNNTNNSNTNNSDTNSDTNNNDTNNSDTNKILLADKILSTYRLIKDPEKQVNYLNYAVNCMGMYYKIMMCNNLKNDWTNNPELNVNNIKFDYCIRMRPDFYWNDSIPPTIFEGITDNNIILVYDNYCTRARWQGNDKFFAGTDTMMNEYCNLYKNFEYFFNKNIRIEGQELAQAMIKKLNLKITFFGNEKTYDKIAGSVHRRLERLYTKTKS